jgi:hypothetical protein
LLSGSFLHLADLFLSVWVGGFQRRGEKVDDGGDVIIGGGEVLINGLKRAFRLMVRVLGLCGEF